MQGYSEPLCSVCVRMCVCMCVCVCACVCACVHVLLESMKCSFWASEFPHHVRGQSSAHSLPLCEAPNLFTSFVVSTPHFTHTTYTHYIHTHTCTLIQHTCTCCICKDSASTMHIHVHVYGFESHLRQLIFSRKSDCLGCAVLLFLVCLFDLACFFLSSFSSLI